MAAKNEQFFLEKYDLTERKLDRIVGEILGGAVNYADLYFEYTVAESLTREEGITKNPKSSTIQGVGARALSGGKTGYAFSTEVNRRTLKEATSAARYIARSGEKRLPLAIHGHPLHDLYPLLYPPITVPFADRARLLEQIEEECRAYDPRIVKVIAEILMEEKRVLIAGNEGLLACDIRPLLRMNVTCIAEENGRREKGYTGCGGRVAYHWLYEGWLNEEERYKTVARDAARQAIVNLSSVDAPAGPMIVVLGPGWPGILLHEAIGHGLEGDFNRKKVSAFTDRIGQKVASDLCTVIDDGTIPNRRGSLNVDDEGTPTQLNILIEKGILMGYLQDRLNAELMGMQPTGNGRRESYQYRPIPRMTNTFMLAGESPPEDIIKSVKHGLYAVSFSGGQVDITNGKFVFSMSEAYLIEDGKVTVPVRGATLIGDGPSVLNQVSMVGNNLAFDQGVGTCGKDGQSVPVGVGLPTIKVDKILVGGTRVEKGDAS